MEIPGRTDPHSCHKRRVAGPDDGNSRQSVHPEAQGGSAARGSKTAGAERQLRGQLSAVSASGRGKPQPEGETRFRNEQGRGGKPNLRAPEAPARDGNAQSDGGAAGTGPRAQGKRET